MADGLCCTLCGNALLRWGWTAPALLYCSHSCLALWSRAQLCHKSHHKCGVVMVIVYVSVVQNLWKMVTRAGIPGYPMSHSSLLKDSCIADQAVPRGI